MGPMTGRGMGYCAGYAAPGYANPGPGRGVWGWGRGGGRGRGWRNWFRGTGVPGWAPAAAGYPAFGAGPVAAAPPSRDVQLDALKAHSEYLEQSLQEVRKRIEELEVAESE